MNEIDKMAHHHKMALFYGLSIGGDKIWQDDEVTILRKLWPDYRAIHQSLPSRTLSAIKLKGRSLRLKFKTVQAWTAAEVSLLRRMYPVTPIEEMGRLFPKRTLRSIFHQASRRRIRKKRQPLPRTGIGALDQIRDRCYDIGWTMNDLTAQCGSARVATFHHSNRRFILRYKDVEDAVRALGGRVVIEWEDE